MYYRRQLGPAIARATRPNKVKLLFGARQTGKTALLRHLLRGPETAVYNLQDSRLRRTFEADPGAFTRELRALPPSVGRILVDEVQKVPALLDEVQLLYDEDHERFSFFLTGSSARKLRTHSANLLPGRSHVYRLSPVVAWETEGDLQPGWPWSRPEQPSATSDDAPPFPAQGLDRLLVTGSLPGVRLEGPGAAALTLEAYVENHIEEEIRREALVRDLGAFSTFLRLAAAGSGRTVNVAHLSQDSGVPAATVRNHYQVLVDTFLGHWMEPYARSPRRRLLTTPRFYLFDLGVRNAAAGLPLDGRILDLAGGDLLEHWVGLELLHRAAVLGRSARVSFWRTRGGAGVDFVFEGADEDVPVEVKWSRSPRPEDARHVEAFLDEYPGRARRGVVVCRVDRPQQLTERVVALPWSSL